MNSFLIHYEVTLSISSNFDPRSSFSVIKTVTQADFLGPFAWKTPPFSLFHPEIVSAYDEKAHLRQQVDGSCFNVRLLIFLWLGGLVYWYLELLLTGVCRWLLDVFLFVFVFCGALVIPEYVCLSPRIPPDIFYWFEYWLSGHKFLQLVYIMGSSLSCTDSVVVWM